MLGAIAGDIIGSIYEGKILKREDVPLYSDRTIFTDDSVLTIAVADSLLSGKPYEKMLLNYYKLYPKAGYGGSFIKMARSGEIKPYHSFGNGSAMRVSPVAYFSSTLEQVLAEAARSAKVTHNHIEGIKGAQAIAGATFLARTGESKEQIKTWIEKKFEYQISESYKTVVASDVSCQGSVPQAIIVFLDAVDFEDTMKKALYVGGDTDTLACMAGAIAEAYYKGVPSKMKEHVFNKLDKPLSKTTKKFIKKYVPFYE